MNSLYDAITAGAGSGAMYVGKGVTAGLDLMGARYYGAYVERDEQLDIEGSMYVPAGVQLVIGQQASEPMTVPLDATWPRHFDNGNPHVISILGRPVMVVFERIHDLPQGDLSS